MKKREFLQILGATSIAMVAGSVIKAQEQTAIQKSKDEEWHNDPENKHTPIVKVKREGDIATVEFNVVKHPQNSDHYIDGVELRDENKAIIFKANILPVIGVSIVECQLKLAVGTKLTALSHCNKHGYYQAPVVL